ncbi:MAG: IclR family transcriptional regulator, partial [Conexibacter sp.]|nr:IclR family transcriptional regulator [Conexibacter sp.]
MLQTVGRAGQVLDLFSTTAPEWGATAVAHELDIAKSQAHELLVSLADIGLLQRHGPGRYRLGWRIVALNSLVVDSSDLGEEPMRVLRALAARTGEAVHLAAWGPASAICVAAFEGHELGARPPQSVGAGLPGHSTASGKVLLAAQPGDALDLAVERGGLARMTERTIATPQRLRDELDGVRRRGFAYEEQEHDLATCSVAAPVRDLHGRVVAAVAMSLPAGRWERSARDGTRAVLGAA